MSNININETNFKKFAKRLQKNSNSNLTLMEAQELLAKTFGASNLHELNTMLSVNNGLKIHVGNLITESYSFVKEKSPVEVNHSVFNCHSLILGDENERRLLTEHIIRQYESHHIFIFDGSNYYKKPVLNKLFNKKEINVINNSKQTIIDKEKEVNVIYMAENNSNELLSKFRKEFGDAFFSESNLNELRNEPKLVIFENCGLGSNLGNNFSVLPAQIRSANTAIIFSYSNLEELKKNMNTIEDFGATMSNISSKYIFNDTDINSEYIINRVTNQFDLELKDLQYKLYTYMKTRKISIEF